MHESSSGSTDKNKPEIPSLKFQGIWVQSLVDVNAHRLEVREKDEEYRKTVVRALAAK